MKLFSQEYAYTDYDDDLSYPTPEFQLQMRLVELKHRLEELSDQSTAFNNPYILTDNDLRYVLPEHLHSVRHVKKAIELVEFDLLNDYGIKLEEPKSESLYAIFVPDEMYLLASAAQI